jgi:hypothetical protein
MTKRLLVSMSVILSTVIAAPGFAQVVAKEPNSYALNIPAAGTGIGSVQRQRQGTSMVKSDAADAAPSVRPWKAGSETATMPWSAPMGHHQPTAVDVIEAESRLTLDQEDANVDRIVRGICRGC